MEKYSRNGLRRIWDAAGFSFRGLQAAWRNEAAFRQELCLALVMLPIAFRIGNTMTQRVLLILSLLLVLIVELLNSAIETSGRAKDMGSAAVMLSLINAGIIWGLIAWGAAFG